MTTKPTTPTGSASDDNLSVTTDLPAWDLTTDPANPSPNVYPVCSTCEVPYVYRRGLSLSHGVVWAWMRDCKHKAPARVLIEPATDNNTTAPEVGNQ